MKERKRGEEWNERGEEGEEKRREEERRRCINTKEQQHDESKFNSINSIQ
jgi:hypothetical protein